ncbi:MULTISPECIES: glycerate kinase family protein [unclassified Rhodococcus (in: high G+C Gram-positive bacteria)]|uniref:glycerate kinase family protein n=1 Tax=unclassified Rhodococcus (in: high G+C Gram-positive bacteria) TaxID=192944 RepID=UPI001C9B411B|nr:MULTISPECIES: glycerate kinase [unclassified Rhodococcus (in: high G+C Gram-positive bacteria)]MBY6681147.1 glycerate kinase [Rhodococcus sp. BP-316]MDQ1179821.1 glycerate kinase [Rhodococcus sp. SORGH_AS_0301]
MRVLIAPDSFGDTLTAAEAADAIAAGWSSARDDELILAPQSDGGPGFVDALAADGGEVIESTVSGPLGDVVTARWLLDGATAYVEVAQTVGLGLLGRSPDPESAVAASSRGVGQIVAEALTRGATTVVVGLGGSSSTDGGAGMIEALGGPDAAVAALADVDLVAATDVDNPLLGPAGAAAVFGPQKGADADTVRVLEERNADWCVELDRVAERAVADLPGAGAAGGLGAALLALGATRTSGADLVAERTRRHEVMPTVDVVLTGEGKFDSQSLRGKVVTALAGSAREHGVRTVVLAGQVRLGEDDMRAAGIESAHSVTDFAGSVDLAMSDARAQLTGLAADVARTGSWA